MKTRMTAGMLVGATLLIMLSPMRTLCAAEEGGAAKAGEAMEAQSAGEEAGTIEASDPVRKNKPKAHWKDRARIVGRLRNAPEAEITVSGADGKPVKSVRVAAGAKVYEVEWLDPGVYSMRIEAKDYQPLELEKLEVGANQDLWVSLEF